jgi:hypothetical protein
MPVGEEVGEPAEIGGPGRMGHREELAESSKRDRGLFHGPVLQGALRQMLGRLRAHSFFLYVALQDFFLLP